MKPVLWSIVLSMVCLNWFHDTSRCVRASGIDCYLTKATWCVYAIGISKWPPKREGSVGFWASKMCMPLFGAPSYEIFFFSLGDRLYWHGLWWVSNTMQEGLVQWLRETSCLLAVALQSDDKGGVERVFNNLSGRMFWFSLVLTGTTPSNMIEWRLVIFTSLSSLVFAMGH